MKKSSSILVTGGEGFLGSYFIAYLRKLGYTKIVSFDRLAHQSNTHPVDSHVTYVQGDILSQADVASLFATHGPFDTVFHLASVMPDKSFSDEVSWNTNVLGTRYVAHAAVQHKTRAFVFTSTNVTYGVPQELPVTEKTPLHPLEVYGRGKQQAEVELEAYKKDMIIQIFRCPVIVAAGRLGLQAILFEFISENKRVYLLGNGTNTYQFVDAVDVSQALVAASQRGVGYEIYTIGADDVVSLRDLFSYVIAQAKSTSTIWALPKTPAVIVLSILDKLGLSPLGPYQYSMLWRTMYADTTKLKRLLGWKPIKTNKASFAENYRWYIKHKETFQEVGSANVSSNRSLPKLKAFRLLKWLS
jgi:UDP-glucose 4-epimerase